MMNAELAAAGEMSILIPAVYRDNYVSALRALSRDAHAAPLTHMLDFAQRFSAALNYSVLPDLIALLAACDAFMKPGEGRLRLPRVSRGE
jgi:hypothetical protein